MITALINGLQSGNRSGTGRYTTELITALAAIEDELELIVAWPAELAALIAGTRTKVIHRSAQPLSRLFFDQWQIRASIARHRVQVVHYPANVGPLLPLPRLVLTVHDCTFLRHPEWFPWNRAMYYRAAVRRSACRAARVIADSQATAEDLMEWLGLPEDRIDVVPLGVDPGFRPADATTQGAIRSLYGLPASYFLYVGTIEPRKNIAGLIDAWSATACAHPCDLVIAGRRGWKMDAVDAAVDRSPHRARIHFTGFVPQENLPALVSAARGFVWPSFFEGFGLPPLEAMACGVPVITSNTSSLPEVVGNAALTVDPADTSALAGAILRLATDDTLAVNLREKGFARAIEFTWAVTARQTLESYRKAAL
jgi:glycosyltransferase involved in cell wall biosynthesis